MPKHRHNHSNHHHEARGELGVWKPHKDWRVVGTAVDARCHSHLCFDPGRLDHPALTSRIGGGRGRDLPQRHNAAEAQGEAGFEIGDRRCVASHQIRNTG